MEASEEELCDEITAALGEYGDTVLECLIPALRLADTHGAAGLDALARHCATRLDGILARPQRADDDWSITWSGCDCERCETLGDLLADRSERAREWPLKAEGRSHVHSQIDNAALHLRHETRRQGRPYTLVLTKTEKLFTRAADERQRAQADRSWLRTHNVTR